MRIEGKKAASAFSAFCAGAVAFIMLLLMAYLLPMSLFRTTGMSTGSGMGEVVSFEYDNFFLNGIMLFICICLFYLIWRFFESRSLKTVMLLLAVWYLVFGFCFVASARLQASEDSYILTFFAREAAKGDLSYYHEYFRFFPYQFGYVLYAEAFFRLFYGVLPNAPEGFSSLALQGLNVVYTAFSACALSMLSGHVFKNDSVRKLTAAFMFLCLPALYFVTYMYGNIPAFACVCASLWLYAGFERQGKMYKGILSAVFLTLSVLFKLNSLIVVVAVGICVFVSFVKRPQLKKAVFALVLALLIWLCSPLPQRLYEKRSGEDFGEGIPMLSWLAMGIHEGDSCSGWYDPSYTTTAFKMTEYDVSATTEIAMDAIKARLEEFCSEPVECRRFFGRKFLSQWNEPSYQGLWTNQVRQHYSKPGLLYELSCHRFERLVKAFMNVYQQLVFFAFTVGLVRLLRRRDMLMSLLPLCVLGGMLYHLLFEAKSQHSQAYFMLMLPVAAYGLIWIFEYLRDNKTR